MEKELKPTKWVSPEIVCSYPNLAQPASEDYGGKYKVSVPLPKSDEKSFALLKEVIKNAAENKWGTKARDLVGKSIKVFVEDCDDDPRYSEDPVYQGCVRFAAKSGRRPGCVIRKSATEVEPVPLEDIEDMFYPGAIIRVSITAYGTETGGSRTVAFTLNNVIFVRHGERIGAGSTPTEDFADILGEINSADEQIQPDLF